MIEMIRKHWRTLGVVTPLLLCAGMCSYEAVDGYDDGKTWKKGSQTGHWTSEDLAEAYSACRRYCSAYRVSECQAQEFCKCTTRNYSIRCPFREFRDDIARRAAHYVEPASSGYFCTEVAASKCPEPKKKPDEEPGYLQ